MTCDIVAIITIAKTVSGSIMNIMKSVVKGQNNTLLTLSLIYIYTSLHYYTTLYACNSVNNSLFKVFPAHPLLTFTLLQLHCAYVHNSI